MLARIGLLVVLLVGGGCSKRATGAENGECYPNQTCNDNLVCLSNVCVNASRLFGDMAGSDGPPADLFSPPDAASSDGSPADLNSPPTMDAAQYNDAGLACPGANIFHPGTESRKVGTSVPFVGHARDAQCVPITGANLVWTDSLEGQIGTGETFSHTFTIIGTHTVTLTATDGSNTYTATVTFMITA
jgi:hypothetical protein